MRLPLLTTALCLASVVSAQAATNQCTTPTPTRDKPAAVASEADATAALQTLTADIVQAPCTTAAPTNCTAISADLLALAKAAAKVTILDNYCSAYGTTDAGDALPAADSAWYGARAALWSQIVTEVKAHEKDGTFAST